MQSGEYAFSGDGLGTIIQWIPLRNNNQFDGFSEKHTLTLNVLQVTM